MAETPPAQLDEQASQEVDVEFSKKRKWIEEMHAAGEDIAARTRLSVVMDYRRGIVIPQITADELTAAQRATIEQLRQNFPNLDIRFHT